MKDEILFWIGVATVTLAVILITAEVFGVVDAYLANLELAA